MEDNLETTEEAFDTIPPEVQEYIYSSDFRQSLADMLTTCNISADNQILFRGGLFEFLAQIDDEEDLLITTNEITTEETARQKIKDWIEINVSQKILPLITEAYINEDEEEDENSNDVPATTTPSSLSSLSDRLKQASIATPAKRDYSLNRTSTTDPIVSETPSTPPRSIDPYHESIDNE